MTFSCQICNPVENSFRVSIIGLPSTWEATASADQVDPAQTLDEESYMTMQGTTTLEVNVPMRALANDEVAHAKMVHKMMLYGSVDHAHAHLGDDSMDVNGVQAEVITEIR